MSQPENNPALHRFALFTASATLVLIGAGGLVTSHGAGLSVPDWPNSYGYNMFWFPPSKWVGGIFYEHTHRLLASAVGLLVIALTRWLGGYRARRSLAIVGGLEMAAGIGVLLIWPGLKATGGFLSGIGGMVLLSALVWARNERAPSPLPQLGWLAFALVQVQGLLGGLRVVLLERQIGVFHAILAQLFFALLCAIALLTSRFWRKGMAEQREVVLNSGESTAGLESREVSESRSAIKLVGLRRLFIGATALIFFQLILGATMRQQHAGLAIPDFPRAYGRLWPATDAHSVALYNARRMEVNAVNPITAFQIELQMVHRMVALLILAAVIACAWRARRQLTRRHPLSMWAVFWVSLILVQIVLGAATILTNKAADVATAHVLVGALSLATGAMVCIISFRNPENAFATAAHVVSGTTAVKPASGALAASAAAAHST